MQKDLGLAAELVPGNAGEFTVWVDEAKVIEKQGGRFPEPKEIVEAVRARGT